jgi:uncharacterized protein YbjT (DUF2867 family)
MKVLLAGSTGYLGKYLLKELKRKGYYTVALTRSNDKLSNVSVFADRKVVAEATKPESLLNICNDIDIVISTLGITRQKDGLTYMDVDYQANLNLLHEAQKSSVKKFIYVSVLNGEKLRHLKICEAKEKFADELKNSGLEYCIIRPNGFFSDMTEIYNMAKNGRVYLFGDGTLKANPIHGEDLAAEIVKTIQTKNIELEIGGPETLSQNKIAKIAFEATGKKSRISHIPDWMRLAIMKLTRVFLNEKIYGPLEFFMTVMAIEMTAPEYGKHTLKDFFARLD